MSIITPDNGWKQYRNSKRWRILDSGAIEVEGDGVIRTRGEPVTARTFLQEHEAAAREASIKFNIPIAWIFGMACVEAVRLKNGFSLNPRSIREEDNYVSDEKTPNQVSPGMMQTLISTAAAMNKKFGLKLDVTREGLFVARTSILLGTAYMRDRADYYKGGVDTGRVVASVPKSERVFDPFDFVYCVAAYNAGKVYPNTSADYPFKMRTFSPTRTERAIRFHNDMIAVLAEGGRC